MAVDLTDRTEALRRKVANPGDDLYASLTTQFLVDTMNDGFWSARLDGLLKTWTCDDDGLVTPVKASDPDMPREFQQLVILYAAIQIVVNELKNVLTVFKVEAGPAKYDAERSAGLLKDILASLRNDRVQLLSQLGVLFETVTFSSDAIIERTMSIEFGDTWNVRGSAGISWT